MRNRRVIANSPGASRRVLYPCAVKAPAELTLELCEATPRHKRGPIAAPPVVAALLAPLLERLRERS